MVLLEVSHKQGIIPLYSTEIEKTAYKYSLIDEISLLPLVRTPISPIIIGIPLSTKVFSLIQNL